MYRATHAPLMMAHSYRRPPTYFNHDEECGIAYERYFTRLIVRLFTLLQEDGLTSSQSDEDAPAVIIIS